MRGLARLIADRRRSKLDASGHQLTASEEIGGLRTSMRRDWRRRAA